MARLWIAPSLGWFLALVIALGINSVGSRKGKRIGELLSGILLFVFVTVQYVFVLEWHRYCRGNNKRLNEARQGNNKESEKTDPSSGGSACGSTCNRRKNKDGDLEEILGDAEATKNITSIPSIQNAKKKSSRLPYLDNVKSLLTALVVTFHCSCSFGGCTDGLWILILGYDDPSVPLWFQRTNSAFVALCQSFFMPLFFFISAYFCPTSYERQGPQAYLTSKQKRLLLPLVAITFTLVPACWALAQSVAGRNLEEINYLPMPAQGWFLLWLLLFNWVYHSYCVYYENYSSKSPIDASRSGDQAPTVAAPTAISPTSSTESGAEDACTGDVTGKVPFPKTWKRWLCGTIICGVLTAILLGRTYARYGTRTFGMMPLTVGSVICNIFMFWMGIQAKTNDWLDGTKKSDSGSSSLRDKHMDISPCTLWCFVLVEAAGMAYLLPDADRGDPGLSLLFLIFAGIYCLDMSLAVLDFFQHYVSFENKVTRFLSQAAYGVFLIHPAVTIGMTSVYIWAFNTIFADDFEAQIKLTSGGFQDGLKNLGTGGGEYSPVGWLLVTISSHLVVWPLAYGMKQLPVLKDIL